MSSDLDRVIEAERSCAARIAAAQAQAQARLEAAQLAAEARTERLAAERLEAIAAAEREREAERASREAALREAAARRVRFYDQVDDQTIEELARWVADQVVARIRPQIPP